jgi:hypothetical protein
MSTHVDGWKGPHGQSITANRFLLERDGKPFIPVIGEFHYRRNPAGSREES